MLQIRARARRSHYGFNDGGSSATSVKYSYGMFHMQFKEYAGGFFKERQS